MKSEQPMNNPIIIIDAPDACGKTTLSNQIMKKYPNAVYIHNGVTDDIMSLHMNTLETAKIASQHHVVIIDRLHLSEHIYGTVYRGKPSYDFKQFDMLVNALPNVKKIICLIDKESCMKIHDERIEDEMFDNVSKVWDMYNEVNDPTWIKYNWKTDNIDLDAFEVTKK